MHKGRLGVAVLLLFAAVFCFSGCNIKSDEKTVFVRDTDPAYIDLLRDIAPDCTVRDGKGLSSLLSSVDGEDKAFALFDVQARASKDAGTGGIWYEHFATAAVIAVDRSRFDGEIKGWRDLEIYPVPWALRLGMSGCFLPPCLTGLRRIICPARRSACCISSTKSEG